MVSRFECLEFLAQVAQDPLVVIWGSGRDEWWHLRPHPPSMCSGLGLATAMGLGLALALPHRLVIVLDSDGGILFNLGALTTLGNLRPPNLKVFVMDNECYESIGAMPSATAGRANLEAIARGAGVEKAATTRTLEEFKEATKRALADNALHFIVAKVEKGKKKQPPHFTNANEQKYRFVRYVEETEKIHIISPPLQEHPERLLK